MRVPSTVRSVAEVIGLPAAVRLMQASYPNGQVYVPAGKIREGHRLASILQPEELNKLQRHFGGELLPYATARGARRSVRAEKRRRAILDHWREGLSPSEIGRALNVSRWLASRTIKEEQARLARKAAEGAAHPHPHPPG